MKYLIFVLFTLNFHSIGSQYHHGIDNNNNYQNADYPTDTGDIHYYIWNDLNKRDNFYPNILRNVQNEFQNSVQSIGNNHETALPPPNGPMTYSSNPNPHPPSIPINQLLTNEMYRSSDSMAIPSFDYAVKQQSLLMDKLGQNDCFYRNRNKLNYPRTWNVPIALKPPDTNDARMSTMNAKLSRPNLLEMYNDKNVHTFKYYSNLPKSKSLSDSLDHWDYSVIKEPILAKQYSTFEMLEPIPQKLILPPVFNPIPEFKPVPPHLRVIPVLSEYLTKYPNQVLSYYRPPMPLNVLSKDSKHNFGASHHKALPNPPVQMIPFNFRDAVTWRSTLNSISPTTPTENTSPQMDQGHFVHDKYKSNIITSIGTLDPSDYKKIPIQQIQSKESTMYGNKINDSSVSETMVNIERNKKRRNKISNYKQKLWSYENPTQKYYANDMNTMRENDIYNQWPVHDLIQNEEKLRKEPKLEQQQQQIRKQNASKIQLSEAYSRQTSNVLMPAHPEEHSLNDNNQLKININMKINDDNMMQAKTIQQSNQFLIAIPDDEDLMPDESTRYNFSVRNNEIRNTSATLISLNQTKQALKEDEVQNYQIQDNQIRALTPEERYSKWFDDFKEKNRQNGKPIFSTRTVPNIQSHR